MRCEASTALCRTLVLLDGILLGVSWRLRSARYIKLISWRRSKIHWPINQRCNVMWSSGEEKDDAFEDSSFVVELLNGRNRNTGVPRHRGKTASHEPPDAREAER